MKVTMKFEALIDAPRARVWDVMLSDATYRKWTEPFGEGGYFEGSWEQGTRMRFLAPGGDGMVAEIAENRKHEFVSIRHLGEIRDGVEDTTSGAVREWAPAHENYAFDDAGSGTRVTIELETMQEWAEPMAEVFPRALALLKELCEAD